MKIWLRFLIFAWSPWLLSQEIPKWDVAKPIGTTTENRFTTDEGTWMSVDVSPDGRTLVFDLLGDLYTMPIQGGKATLLSGGAAWEVQPRFRQTDSGFRLPRIGTVRIIFGS